ncbi:hypothetical protein ACH6EH_15225 [Paenibacillus sp. JSM ZJ436]|uniref:hypothetical protein n=1 Tax=Paenibacillus sp. JSM ZJ436 TaxID=3376190 RepID=UPI00378E8104
MKSQTLLIFITILSSMLLTSCDSDLCTNDVVEKLDSPDNSKSAVIFIRACGATTDESYQLSILEEGEDLTNQKGNIYISKGNFEVDWSNNNKIHVSFYSSEVFKQETQFQDVEIEYEYKKNIE